jgi:hypothetical protein
MMGWDEHFLQSAVDTCTNPSGQIEDCPLFNIQSSDKYSNCDITLPQPLMAEKVLDDMSTLPGNVPIAYGPGIFLFIIVLISHANKTSRLRR